MFLNKLMCNNLQCRKCRWNEDIYWLRVSVLPNVSANRKRSFKFKIHAQ